MRDLDSSVVYLAAEMLEGSLPDNYRSVGAAAGATFVLNNNGLLAHTRDIVALVHGPQVQVAGAAVASNALTQAQATAFYTALEAVDHRGHELLSEAMMLIVAGCAKAGSASREWVRSRTNQMGATAGVDVTWGQRDIQDFWNRFGSKVGVAMAGWQAFFTNVENNAGQNLRLQIVAQQAR